MDQAIVARQVAAEDIGDPRLSNLLLYWELRRGARRLPQRQDLLPEEMGALLGRIALIETDPKGEFRFRLVGTKLRSVLGRDLTGESFRRLSPPHLESLLRSYCSAAMTELAPKCVQIIAKRDRQSFSYQVLMLPISSVGIEADMALLAFNWAANEVPLIDPLNHGPV